MRDSRAISRYMTAHGAQHYSGKFERSFARRRTARREAGILGEFLEPRGETPSLLNVPCGTGRFRDVLRSSCHGRLVFGDRSPTMLAACRDALVASRLDAVECRVLDVLEPPRDIESFDTVVSLRLLHHLHRFGEKTAALDYLCNSAQRKLIVTYASRSTWRGWWRSTKTKLGLRPPGESFMSRGEFADALRRRGFRIVATRHVSRAWSSQVYVLAVRDAACH